MVLFLACNADELNDVSAAAADEGCVVFAAHFVKTSKSNWNPAKQCSISFSFKAKVAANKKINKT